MVETRMKEIKALLPTSFDRGREKMRNLTNNLWRPDNLHRQRQALTQQIAEVVAPHLDELAKVLAALRLLSTPSNCWNAVADLLGPDPRDVARPDKVLHGGAMLTPAQLANVRASL